MSIGISGYDMAPADLAAAQSPEGESITPQALMSTEGDTALPEQVAFLPVANPGTDFPVAMTPGVQSITADPPQELEAAAQTGQTTETAPADTLIAKTEPQAEPQATPASTADNPVYVTAGEIPAAPAAPKKKSFLASLFGATPAAAKAPKPAAKAIITLASAEHEATPVKASISAFSGDALPGVRRQTALFEITRRSGSGDDSDVDLNEDEGAGLYQVASAAGLARLAPNGLLKQTESVDVACLKPSLVRVLKTIESHYGKKMVVTSGYRDPARNRRARGAKRSLHMYCAAADIQVPGVGKWELANYIRSMPGRGGVGTYCHTKSVHVDVGPERDWNWRCRRRK